MHGNEVQAVIGKLIRLFTSKEGLLQPSKLGIGSSLALLPTKLGS